MVDIPKLDKIRFGVGSKAQRRSSLWVIVCNKDDVYVGVRGLTGLIKVSLHKFGGSSVAFSRRYLEQVASAGLDVPSDRAFVRWKRSATPTSGAVHVMSILFPSDFLLLNAPPQLLTKPVYYLKPAPQGHAIEIGLFYSKEPPATLGDKLAKISIPMFNAQLPCGEYVSLVGRIVPFDKTQYDGLKGTLKRLRKDAIPEFGQEWKNVSAMLFNEPNDGEALQLIELTGFTFRRGDG